MWLYWQTFITGGGAFVGSRVAHNRLDVTGQIFGYITALNYIKSNNNGKAIWLFRCVCGTEFPTVLASVISGNTRSCGCNNTGRVVQKEDIKICRVCKIQLESGVNFRESLSKYKNWICNTCKSEYDLRLLHKNPNRNHASSIKAKYNMTSETYEEMYNHQNGECKICGNPFELHGLNRNRLYVDHNHITGEVRGLLCKNCNAGLGQFKENIEAMKKAILYLNGNKV